MMSVAPSGAPGPQLRRWAMSTAMLAEVMVPYRLHCQYLTNCTLEYAPVGPGVSADVSEASIAAEGDCTVGESCYIDSTGHFNAVEFQICCNQIMYAMFAECVAHRLVRSFLGLNLEQYWERRLPNVLITNVNSVFRRPINPRAFRVRHQLDRSYLMRDRAFWESRILYTDDDGGHAEGTVVGTMALGEKLAPTG
jgi:hypothetical protein